MTGVSVPEQIKQSFVLSFFHQLTVCTQLQYCPRLLQVILFVLLNVENLSWSLVVYKDFSCKVDIVHVNQAIVVNSSVL